MKHFLKILLLALVTVSSSCIMDSYPYKWKNTHLQWDINTPEVIQVKYGMGDWHEEPNGENHHFLLEQKGDSATVTIHTINRIDKAYFDGFAIKANEEIEWNFTNNNRTIEATNVFLSGYEIYEASLSEEQY